MPSAKIGLGFGEEAAPSSEMQHWEVGERDGGRDGSMDGWVERRRDGWMDG